MEENVTYHCQHCPASFVRPAADAGQIVTCPNCGAQTSLTLSSAPTGAGGAATRSSDATPGATAPAPRASAAAPLTLAIIALVLSTVAM